MGGGIWNSDDGRLTLTASTVTGNEARGGGGIDNDGTLDIADSVIRGNSADLGGGIWNNGELEIADSTVRDNEAESGGGGIYNHEDGALTLTGSTVNGNSAVTLGGGILNQGKLDITDCNIRDNEASSGGGILNREGGTLTLTASTVAGNLAAALGGGIGNLGELDIIDSEIGGNEAQAGGGIWNNGELEIADSTVRDNEAESGGGGIYNHEDGALTLTGSTVNGNSARQSADILNVGSVRVIDAPPAGSQPVAADHRAEAEAYMSSLLAYYGILTDEINAMIGMLNDGGSGSYVAADTAQNIMIAFEELSRLEPPACLSSFHDRQVTLLRQYHDGAQLVRDSITAGVFQNLGDHLLGLAALENFDSFYTGRAERDNVDISTCGASSEGGSVSRPPTSSGESSPTAAADGRSPTTTGGVPLYEAKVSDLWWGALLTIFDVPSAQRDAVNRQVEEVRESGQQVIICTYGPSDPVKKVGYRIYEFWYEGVPDGIVEMLGSTPSGTHPMRRLGLNSITECPESPELALRQRRSGMIP